MKNKEILVLNVVITSDDRLSDNDIRRFLAAGGCTLPNNTEIECNFTRHVELVVTGDLTDQSSDKDK
jgi:hypothetical protein